MLESMAPSEAALAATARLIDRNLPPTPTDYVFTPSGADLWQTTEPLTYSVCGRVGAGGVVTEQMLAFFAEGLQLTAETLVSINAISKA